MDELLKAPWAAGFFPSLGRERVKAILGGVLEGIRGEILSGAWNKAEPLELLVSRSLSLLSLNASSTLKPVVNATGVVIHTNLGRAPLAQAAREAVNSIAGTYSTLEYSPESGGRGGRNTHVEWLIRHITGAEAALAVNNNAAAVLLALAAIAAGREVIVSSGELVEIGDSFRIPDILAFSGAKMISVGCTNSTRIRDYRDAITEHTAALLKVHPSNYRIAGFVKSVSREELAELAADRGLAFIEDLGSGLLCPLNLPFADREHSVRDCIKAGSGIVCFSGDKLLGGPQIGIIAGSKALIDRMRGHQLLRALRVDKMTLAAFEATLRLYLSEKAGEIPVIRMIGLDASALRERAQELCGLLRRTAQDLGAELSLSVVETIDAVGGGAFPTDPLPGFGVGLRAAMQNAVSQNAASLSAESLAGALRTARIPVIPGIREGQVILHVRTLLDGDEARIAAAFSEALSKFR
jgi:L-seryl-tRNA(Ser) seleniumtransferase